MSRKYGLLWSLCILTWTTVSLGQQRMTVHAGIDRGGPAIGFDYSVPDTTTESFGIYGRLHSKDRDAGAPGLFALGAFFRSHFQQGPYEFYLAPGFGFINYDLFETEVLLGPSLAYGMTAELDAKLGIGIENHKLYSWFGDQKGTISDTFLVHVQFRL
ncbi:MAG: hypothetical protein ACOH5I_07680 [Oligoflexus sp.]